MVMTAVIIKIMAKNSLELVLHKRGCFFVDHISIITSMVSLLWVAMGGIGLKSIKATLN